MLPAADSPRMGRGPDASRVLMLIEATSDIASRITGAIQSAANATGASFEYLLKTAQRESNFNPNAKAGTSSATGLFQFIEQTWLQTLKSAGPSLGYARHADSIERTASGRYVVPDPAERQAILALRKDPVAASAMAGAFTQSNAAFLSERLGRAPTEGELYIAHFLGPNGAAQLISTAEKNPRANAAELFPQAARANRSIFYRGRQSPRSVAQVYTELVSKHRATTTPAPPATAPSSATALAAQQAVPPPGSPAAIVASRWPQMPASVNVQAVDATRGQPEEGPPAAFAPDRPAFHQLFHSAGSAPVSAFVSELWGARRVHNPQRVAAAHATANADAARPGRPLELFQFLRPGVAARTQG
jgi:hypothetical protein